MTRGPDGKHCFPLAILMAFCIFSVPTLLGQSLPSGSARSIVVAPGTPPSIYSGAGLGVFKSTDGGSSWTDTGLPPSSTVMQLAVDPTNASTLYVATADGVIVTRDGGQSWSSSPTGCSESIAVVATVPTTIYAGACGWGINKSIDAGKTWTTYTSGIGNRAISALAVDPSSPTTIYAGTYTADVLKSSDGGQTWASLTTGLGDGISVLLIDPINTARLWAGTYRGLYVSANRGQSWLPVTSGLPAEGIGSMIFDPLIPNRMYLGLSASDGFYFSVDRGQTWSASFTGLPNQFASIVHGLASDPSNACVLYAATNTDTIYKSANCGATWSAANVGIQALEVYGIGLNPANESELFVGTNSTGVYRSEDSGANWSNAGYTGSGVVLSLAVNPSKPQDVVAVDNGIVFTDNSGLTWNSLPYYAYSGLAIDPNNNSVLYAGGFAESGALVLKSTDFGKSWTTNSSGLPVAVIFAIAVDPGNSSSIFAATMGSGIYHSPDAGQSWFAIPSQPSLYIEALAFDRKTPAALYAGSTNGLFKSSTGGQSWSQIAGLPVSFITALAFDPIQTNTMWVGGFEGIAKSVDGGNTWTLLNSGLEFLYVQQLAIDPSNPNIVYAGLNGGGLYKSTNGGQLWQPLGAAHQLPCSFSLAPQGMSLPQEAFVGSLAVATGTTCSWSATPSAPWITILPGASRGPAKLNFAVAANNSPVPRIGNISIAGLSFSIFQQAMSCTYAVNPSFASLPAGGGPVNVAVSAPADCPWTISNIPGWVTVQYVSASSGNGGVSLYVSANAGTARSASLAIAGQNFSVSQNSAAQGTAVCGASDVTSVAVPFQGQFVGIMPPGSNLYSQQVTIRNQSSSFINGPLYYVLIGLPTPAGAGLASQNSPPTYCFSSAGSQKVFVSGAGLAPGQTVSFGLTFVRRPSSSAFSYTPKVISGNLSK